MRSRHKIFITAFLIILISKMQVTHAQHLPRTVIGLYDGKSYEDTSKTNLYHFAEKPLNHLGIKIEYYDIHQGLPELNDLEDILGIITWFIHGENSIDSKQCLEWSKEAVKKGLKYVVFGEGIFQLEQDKPLPMEVINEFWSMLGMKEGGWVSDNYLSHVINLDPSMMNFERNSRIIYQPYKVMQPISNEVLSHATARNKNDSSNDSGLVMTSKKGAYLDTSYVLFSYISDITGSNYYWNVNPFELFRVIFDTDTLPKPDISTEAGRRIYYSHIDGDGWNNAPQLTRYKENKPKISAETVYREVLSPFPDMPCSCGAIGADISEDWVGTEESRRIARMIYELPQVEVASHTLSHPFHWYFYEDYLPQDEIAYLRHYVNDGWAGNQRYEDTYRTATENIRKKELAEGYDTPRGFADHPFDLHEEIQGSLDIINANSPEGKNVQIFFWSGDCVPFEKAIKATRDAGIKNMNGGDAQFDYIFSSYTWIPPIGRWVNGQLQVHCSGSNENTYTNLWHDKFWAFSNVPLTYINSEFPVRVIPMNLYYHIYCAENEPALSSLIKNVQFAEKQDICPMFASTYAAIAEGFYSIEFTKIEKRSWKITNRGRLNTIRFDRATLQSVNFEESEGVIGQRHYQGSLYVYLDRQVEAPVISLKDTTVTDEEPSESSPYLINSRWSVWNLERKHDDEFTFTSKGVGKGEMSWNVPKKGFYSVAISDGENSYLTKHEVDSNILMFELPNTKNRTATLTISRI